MPTIKAFDGFLVKSEFAAQVVSPAYDSVSPKARREFADANPDNFLNTMRLKEDFATDSQISQAQLLEFNKSNLERLLSEGFFEPLNQPCFFVYQLITGSHVQTGLVCEVGVEEYEQNKIKKHENTRSDKEDLLAHYQKVVGASSSPICLTYHQDTRIDSAISRHTLSSPDLEFTAEDGVIQKVWRLTEAYDHNELIELFNTVKATYLTDGHHRAASGRRYAEIMRQDHGNTGDEPFNQLLVALFPDSELNLLPFHRCVKETNGLSEAALLEALSHDFDVSPLDEITHFQPQRHGQFGMYLNRKWFELNIKADRFDSSNPVDSLDVTVLQTFILDPILGIKDTRSDPKLDYIAGISGIEGIEQKAAEGWAITFTCYATSIDQLMDVADADALMPPKSTYFDPKPRSGIFVRLK